MRAEGQANVCSSRIESEKPIRPKWALLIAKIFGTLPIACPKCNTVMELKACITDPTAIAKACPHSARAPPQLTFDRYHPPQLGIAYGKIGDEVAEPTVDTSDSDAHFNQTPPDDDAFFNQDCEG